MQDVEFIRDKVPLAGLFGVARGFGLDRLSAGKASAPSPYASSAAVSRTGGLPIISGRLFVPQ
jgi:hypothetical protein